jgi:Ser/Thr protein kinase RdoA (MazF antagonist)
MSGQPNELGRFARLGWIDELLSRIGIDRSQNPEPVIHQLNQGLDFCLLNLKDAGGRNLWFKAVGEPNTREYQLTLELTRRFPQYLPRLVATISEWNGWVAESVEGVPLNESASLGDCKQALTALATMQQATTRDADSLLALGAKDWTYARIASLSEPFFEDARPAMKAQTSTRSKPLTDIELDELQSDVGTTLREFMEPDIPDTLVHGDIGHGNIIATADGPVFLDWAETYIGHPFLCAEHLLADLARSHPTFAKEQAHLRSFYVDHWRTCARAKDLETIAALAPVVAAFVYALVAWEANQHRTNPNAAWPLVRSMLRRTKRELDNASEVIR